MKIQILVGDDSHIIDPKKLPTKPFFDLDHCESFVLRLSEVDVRAKRPKDDGFGNEASFWSLWFGAPAEIAEAIQIWKLGSWGFTNYDATYVLPFVEAQEDQEKMVCCVCNVPKPHVRDSGRFLGPDKQPWVTDELMEKIVRSVFGIPTDTECAILFH